MRFGFTIYALVGALMFCAIQGRVDYDTPGFVGLLYWVSYLFTMLQWLVAETTARYTRGWASPYQVALVIIGSVMLGIVMDLVVNCILLRRRGGKPRY